MQKTVQKTVPSYLAEPQIQYLSQLLDDIHNGNLFIPKFQRGLVWDDQQRLDLLRSIKEGISIGSILVWRTSRQRLATFDKLGPCTLPSQPEPTPGAPRTYLLDGHQRLSTLFGALEKCSGSGTTSNKSNEAGEKNWNFLYDLEDEDFILQGRKKSKHVLMPLNVMLDSLALLKFQRTLENEGYIEKSDQLSTVFRNYKIAVVPLVTNDLEHATTAFKRINSSGTKMDDVDMVAALTWSEDFDLKENLEKVRADLEEVGWGNLEDKLILSACRAVLKVEIYKANAEETSEKIKQEGSKIFEEVTSRLIRAARFFAQHCGIKSPNMLPYNYQSVLLAEALWIEPRPNEQIVQALKDWLWRTAYTMVFSGINEGSMQKVLQSVRKLARGEFPSKGEITDKIEPLPNSLNLGTSSRAKLLVLRLAELKPRSSHGKIIEATDLLGLHGKEAIFRLFAGKSSPENCFIVSPKDHSAFRYHLLEQTKWSQAFLKSHAISESAAKALKQRDYDNFLQERRKTLIDLEKSFIQPLGLDYEEEE